MADFAFCPKKAESIRSVTKEMKSTTNMRVKRTLTALLLMFVFSFSTVFAETELQTEGAVDTVQTETPADSVRTDAPAETGESTVQEESAAEAKHQIIKKGKYYYYQRADGTIRKTPGFVSVDGKKYFVRKGGKIKTSKTFKVNGKYYRANKYGIIRTGVYTWNGNRYYSYSSGAWCKKEGFITWEGDKYYIQKGGKIRVNDPFCVNNMPYSADSKGKTAPIEIPDGDCSPVVAIAKEQVGITTGVTYWVWYYKRKFKDTDRTPWCGAFVAWCYNKAGLYDKITVAKKFGPLGYVPSYSRYADKYDKWVSRKKALGGDIIVFGRNMHVGLIEGISGDYIVTIEGNAGPTAAIGCGKPGAVVRNVYKINNKKIKGVIRPD